MTVCPLIDKSIAQTFGKSQGNESHFLRKFKLQFDYKFSGEGFRKSLPKLQDDLTKREGIYRLAHGSNESLRPYCLDGAINSASRYRGDKLKVEPNEVSPEVDARRADLISEESPFLVAHKYFFCVGKIKTDFTFFIDNN